MALDSRPARKLTDRECTRILGGVIGGLMTMADGDTVRAAMRWWVDSDASWEVMKAQHDAAQAQGVKMAEEFFGKQPHD